MASFFLFFFFQAEDGIRDTSVTGVQTCALPISSWLSLAPPMPSQRQWLRNAPSPLIPGLKVWQCACAWACIQVSRPLRSEERRVGKECRARCAAGQLQEKVRLKQ